MTPSAIRVLGSGSAMVDVLARVEDSFLPQAGGAKGGMVMVSAEESARLRALLPSSSAELGGSTANTIFGLLHLGVPAALLAKTGRDEEGAFYRKRFAQFGGDTRSFKESSSGHTGCCVSLVTPDSERTMRTFLGASSEVGPEDVSDSDFEGITHLHVEGYQLFCEAYFQKLMETAKKHRVTVSLDLASFEVVKAFRDRIDGILREYVDVVFANEDEAAAFLDLERVTDPEAAVSALLERCPAACVKLGKKGACIGRRGEPSVRTEARLVHAVDTTGAGDLWQAGFLYGYLNGKPLSVCGKMGTVLGAEVVQVMGGAIPQERWPEIRKTVSSL